MSRATVRYRAVRADRFGVWKLDDVAEMIGVCYEPGDKLIAVRFENGEEYEISERLFHISFTKISERLLNVA